MKLSPYTDGERLYGNVSDDELNANYEPEEVETFVDRRLKRQRELKQSNQNHKLRE